jgi:hypothetical protein
MTLPSSRRDQPPKPTSPRAHSTRPSVRYSRASRPCSLCSDRARFPCCPQHYSLQTIVNSCRRRHALPAHCRGPRRQTNATCRQHSRLLRVPTASPTTAHSARPTIVRPRSRNCVRSTKVQPLGRLRHTVRVRRRCSRAKRCRWGRVRRDPCRATRHSAVRRDSLHSLRHRDTRPTAHRRRASLRLLHHRGSRRHRLHRHENHRQRRRRGNRHHRHHARHRRAAQMQTVHTPMPPTR